MTGYFTINFRREARRAQLEHERLRALMLALWGSYFGVLVLVIGLYGMNFNSLVRSAGWLERQVASLRALQFGGSHWDLPPTDLGEIERNAANSLHWRDCLVRLATILPPDMRLTSLAANPDNAVAGQRQLVISGELRRTPGRDRTQDVLSLVTTLRQDSLFASAFQNVKLVSTRASEGQGATVVFVIRCE
jgi:Tfp pilus assembly protein PilN